MFDWIKNATSAEVLNVLETGTWIATGLVGAVVIMRAGRLLLAYKGLSKEEKTKELLGVISALCVIGIFWCVFFIWGEPIAAGYN